MNVMLNIPAETGAERAGTTTRRSGEAGAEDFGALFDEVAKTTTAGRRPQSGSVPETAKTVDMQDDGESDSAARRAGTCAESATPEETASPRSESASVVAPPGKAARSAPTDEADPAADGRRNDQTDQADAGRAKPADAGADAPPVAADGPRHARTDAAVDPRRDPDRADRKKDGAVQSADADTASAATAVAVPPAEVRAEQQQPDGAAAADRPARPSRTDGAAGSNDQQKGVASDTSGKLVKGAAERGMGNPQRAGVAEQQDPAADTASSSKPAVSDGGGDPVRAWGRSDAAAAPANGTRQVQTDVALEAAQAEQETRPAQRSDQRVNVRVTGYERHLAPLAPAAARGVAQAAMHSDGAAAGNATPTPANGAQVAAGLAEVTGAPRKGQDWRPLASADRTGSATARAPSGERGAARDEWIAVAAPTQRSQHDRPDGRQDRTMDAAVSATHTDAKRQAASEVAKPGSTQAAGPAAPSNAPAAPLTAGVASAIVGAVDSARAAASQSAPQRADAPPGIAASGPVQTITLNLDMREHGSVDLRISLKGNAVSVRLKADRPETALALARDDASLRDLLHRAGYETQQVQIDKRDAVQPRFGDAAASGQQQAAGGAATGGFSGHSTGDQRAASPQQQRQQGQRDGFILHDQDTQDAPRQDRYRGPDRLYV